MAFLNNIKHSTVVMFCMFSKCSSQCLLPVYLPSFASVKSRCFFFLQMPHRLLLNCTMQMQPVFSKIADILLVLSNFLIRLCCSRTGSCTLGLYRWKIIDFQKSRIEKKRSAVLCTGVLFLHLPIPNPAFLFCPVLSVHCTLVKWMWWCWQICVLTSSAQKHLKCVEAFPYMKTTNKPLQG